MYKKINIFLALLLFFSFSCSEDFLELENKNALTDGNFYQTSEDFRMALNSCYGPLMGLYGLQMNYLFGSFDDRILFESPGMDQLTDISPSFGHVSNTYRSLYQGKFRVNTFIYKLIKHPEIEGMNDDLRNNYLAQAKALRAAFNFWLVVIFDRPPFYDENTIPEDITVHEVNGKREDFWNLIERDLKFAAEHLPPTWGPTDAGRITSGAAKSLLGKAMLYKHYYYYARLGQNNSAEDIAALELSGNMLKDVINSGTYSLVKPKEPKTRNDYIYALLSNFSYVDLPVDLTDGGRNIYQSKNNEESVWKIQFSDERMQSGWLPGWQWSGAMNAGWFSPHESSFKNHEVHPDLWDAFETEGAPEGFDRDPRAYATLYIEGDTMDFRPESPYFKAYRFGINNKRVARSRGLIPPDTYPTRGFGLKKYYFPVYHEANAPLNDPINVNFIRFADVLIMYAEVTYLLNQETDVGLQALNRVRARVDMPPVAQLTKEAIIHERDVELALEAKRWFDLVRWSFDPDWGIDMRQILSRQISPDGTGDFYEPGKHEFMPIPIREYNLARGNLEQNPGW